MNDLASWVLEQIAEDERTARAATPGPWRYNPAKEWHSPEELAKPPIMRLPGEEFVGAGPLDATIGVAATGPADDPQSMVNAAYIATWDPARVLAECDAKRKIIAMWEDPAAVRSLPEGVHDGRDDDEMEAQVASAEAINAVVHLVALPYADRPGYREDWRP